MRKKPFQILIVVFTFCVSNLVSGQDTVRVSDFGLNPGTRENAVKTVQQALEVCKTKKHPVLVFSKGRYDFWPQSAVEKLGIVNSDSISEETG